MTNDRKNIAQKFSFYVYLTLLEYLSRYLLSSLSILPKNWQYDDKIIRSD